MLLLVAGISFTRCSTRAGTNYEAFIKGCPISNRVGDSCKRTIVDERSDKFASFSDNTSLARVTINPGDGSHGMAHNRVNLLIFIADIILVHTMLQQTLRKFLHELLNRMAVTEQFSITTTKHSNSIVRGKYPMF